MSKIAGYMIVNRGWAIVRPECVATTGEPDKHLEFVWDECSGVFVVEGAGVDQ